MGIRPISTRRKRYFLQILRFVAEGDDTTNTPYEGQLTYPTDAYVEQGAALTAVLEAA